MLNDRIEAAWISAFEATFVASGVDAKTSAIILSETQSRDLNVHLAELALARLGARFFHVKIPSPGSQAGPVLRSTGMSLTLDGQTEAVAALKSVAFIVDLTLEGLMHARQTGEILGAGARVLTVSNEHPEVLARMPPDPELKAQCLDAARLCRGASTLHVTSPAGSDLTVSMVGANTVGVWGYTDKPGTLAHWPGGIVVSFPAANCAVWRLPVRCCTMHR